MASGRGRAGGEKLEHNERHNISRIFRISEFIFDQLKTAAAGTEANIRTVQSGCQDVPQNSFFKIFQS